MRKYHKAGESVLVLARPDMGQTSVVVFASDTGYCFRRGSGPYPPGRCNRLPNELTATPAGPRATRASTMPLAPVITVGERVRSSWTASSAQAAPP